MAVITYPWNPFQDRIDCTAKNEIIKPSANDLRREFVPRYAPFFAKNFKLFRQGSTTPLVLGEDYAFAHPFKEFVQLYKRNVYGSVVLLKNISAVLTATYDTIGTPFVLNEVAYATLVANIANSPRQAYWDNLVGVPTEWPPAPHEHPASETYDYLDMMESLEQLVLVISGAATGTEEMTVRQLLEDHMAKDIPTAHACNLEALSLDLVPNMRKATIEDLAGNSANATVTPQVLKEALRLLAAGKLDLN